VTLLHPLSHRFHPASTTAATTDDAAISAAPNAPSNLDSSHALRRSCRFITALLLRIQTNRIESSHPSRPSHRRYCPALPPLHPVRACRAWETERAKILRDRSSKAEADKQASLTAAREEVQKFYADRDTNVGKQQKTNRTYCSSTLRVLIAHYVLPFICLCPLPSADEKNYRSDMKTTFESGARWEKVNKLISTQPRPNEKAGTSRVDRMRKVLLQLKTEKKA
jgi:hypothetical protein